MDLKVPALIDPGSKESVLLVYITTAYRLLVEQGKTRTLRAFSGGRVTTIGTYSIKVAIRDNDGVERAVTIRIDIVEQKRYKLILGRLWLGISNLDIDWSATVLR